MKLLGERNGLMLDMVQSWKKLQDSLILIGDKWSVNALKQIVILNSILYNHHMFVCKIV